MKVTTVMTAKSIPLDKDKLAMKMQISKNKKVRKSDKKNATCPKVWKFGSLKLNGEIDRHVTTYVYVVIVQYMLQCIRSTRIWGNFHRPDLKPINDHSDSGVLGWGGVTFTDTLPVLPRM